MGLRSIEEKALPGLVVRKKMARMICRVGFVLDGGAIC